MLLGNLSIRIGGGDGGLGGHAVAAAEYAMNEAG